MNITGRCWLLLNLVCLNYAPKTADAAMMTECSWTTVMGQSQYVCWSGEGGGGEPEYGGGGGSSSGPKNITTCQIPRTLVATFPSFASPQPTPWQFPLRRKREKAIP